MQCTMCDAHIPDDAQFCIICGAIVRGLMVRSANLGGQIAAALQSIRGGNIRTMTAVCEHARTDAFLMALAHAAQLGANAIIGFRYDTTEVAEGMTEVLAYETAVIVEPETGTG